MRHVLWLSFFMVSCVSNPRSSDLGENTDTSRVSTISFANGSSALTPIAVTALETLLAQTRASEAALENIQSVITIAWADHEYQANGKSIAQPAEAKLANQRNQAITEFYRSRLPRAKFRAYNMAEHPNEFEKLLSTTDAQMKRLLERSGGNASTAVVLLIAQ